MSIELLIDFVNIGNWWCVLLLLHFTLTNKVVGAALFL